MSKRLAKLLLDRLPDFRADRTNILGALSQQEFQGLYGLLVGCAESAENWQGLGRSLREARVTVGLSPIRGLKEREWVQVCNILAAILVKEVVEFKPSLWHYVCGTQAE